MTDTNLSTRRVLTFLLGCILTRVLLVILASKLKEKNLFWLGLIIFILGLSFIYLYLVGNISIDEQTKIWGDKKIWWNNLRPIHGFLLITFGVLAMKNVENSWVILLIDVIVGLISWMIHHKIICL